MLNSTGNELQRTVNERLSGGVLGITSSLNWSCALQVVGHCADEMNDFVVILQLRDVTLNVINGLPLSNNEAFAVTNLGLNGIKEQIMTLLLFVLNIRDVASKDLRVLRLRNLDEVLFARVKQEQNASLSLLTQLDSLLIDQLCHFLALVHIEELGGAQLPQSLHDFPGIILWSCKFVQLHSLWSPNHRSFLF